MNWEIDKKINIGNAITALMIAMSVFWWAAQVEKRIAILEVEIEDLAEELLQLEERS